VRDLRCSRVREGSRLLRRTRRRGLKRVVAKRQRDPYRPGERYRATARFAEERNRAGRSRVPH